MQAAPARRELDFRDFDALVRDIESLSADGYESRGKWDLAQVCRHLAEWMRFPLDGYPRPPLPIRLMLWTMRKTIGKRELKKILESRRMPGGGPTLPETVPAAGGDDAAAVKELLQVIARFRAHEGPFHPSPLFGELGAEDCTQLQLIHCSHHLSFLVPKTAL
jgi:hypothetical protein